MVCVRLAPFCTCCHSTTLKELFCETLSFIAKNQPPHVVVYSAVNWSYSFDDDFEQLVETSTTDASTKQASDGS